MSRWITVFILLLVAAGWLVPDYVGRMWKAGHYQFFPMVFLGVAALVYSRRARLTAVASEPKKLGIAFGFTAVCFLILAGHLLCSNFLGLVGFIAAAITLVYAAWGWGGLRSAGPILGLLIFAVPLPLQLDQDLIVEMQFLASGLASQILDGLNIVHFREGVVLQTEKSKFLTEEACSGIRSLFSSLFVVAATCLWLQLAWPRTIINILQTVVWVLLGNALRVAAVVLLADHVSPWFATGLGHELLGLAVFGFILFMVFSTDQAISLGLQWWMGVPFNPEMEMELARARGLEVEERTSSKPFASDSEVAVPDTVPLPELRMGSRAFAMVCAGLVFVSLVGVRVAWVRGSALGASATLAMPEIPEPAEADMPEMLVGWQRVEFEHQERDLGGLLAEHSYMWTYRKGNQQAIFSIDRPWGDWHNLYYCYTGLGWETTPTYFIEQAGQPMRHSELELDRGMRRGFVLYGAVDRKGREVAPPGGADTGRFARIPNSIPKQIAASLGFGGQDSPQVQAIDLPASTLQLYAEGGLYNEEEKQALRELYFAAREYYLTSNQPWSVQ